jgi:hypothetical protein
MRESALSEFTLFSSLPVELRLKIWAFCYTLQTPRIVEVRTHPNPDHSRRTTRRRSRKIKSGNTSRSGSGSVPGPGNGDEDADQSYPVRFSPTPQPTLFNICHESRAAAHSEALKTHHLHFNKTIIFNPATDILYLPTEASPIPAIRAPTGTWTQFKKELLAPDGGRASQLRFLALDLERYGNQFNPMRCAIADFPALHELLFVVPEGGVPVLPLGALRWLREYGSSFEALRDALEGNLRMLQRSYAKGWMAAVRDGDGARGPLGRVDGRRWPRVMLGRRWKGGFEVLGEKRREFSLLRPWA